MKRPQLLSDDDCEAMVDICGNAYFVAEDIRNKYEAARSKDAELIQQLGDALTRVDRYSERDTMNSEDEDDIISQWTAALDAFKAAGFNPSNP